MSESLATADLRLKAALYFQLSAFVMVVYDHFLTLEEEVTYIWGQKLNVATLLFFLNRYVTPLEFIVVLLSIKGIGHRSCAQFVAFEGAGTTALVTSKLLLGVELHELLTHSNSCRTCDDSEGLRIIWTTETAAHILTAAVGWTSNHFVDWHSIGICCASPSPASRFVFITARTRPLFPSLWVAPLILDSIIFLLTIYRTRRYLSQNVSTAYILMRDGTMYFLFIFIANASNVLIYYTAADDLKAFGASFSQLITSLMISRLILNLRQPRDGWENPLTRSRAKLNDDHGEVGVVATQFVSNAMDMMGSTFIDEQETFGAKRERFVRETIQQHSRTRPGTAGSIEAQEGRLHAEVIELHPRSRPSTADSAAGFFTR
ncbi:hypothetical protein D9758_008554 [Tetrapyrgos nigripes]|uniref:DUF6533 domain-containing protein n=1 Tax=Tetrapyrgos nigripes TaxID=182062 RepID=A0A8H5G5S8_9AGAR|nr:hypothetical protein D9758_008554 [Tetrapyrgos nigripes]